MNPEINILVVPIEKAKGIDHLLDIVVSGDAKVGKKTPSYYLVSTATNFIADGSHNVEFYNHLMLQAQQRGYGYIQFTFNEP